MSAPNPAHPHPLPPPAAPARTGPTHPVLTGAGLVVLLAAVVTVVFTALGLPAAKSAPHEVPIGLAGPQQAVSSLDSALRAQDPGAFATTEYADAGRLRAAIADRDVYGGLVVGADGAQVLTASAGSPVIATSLDRLATTLGQRTGRTVPVEDVVPLPATDPRGTGLAAAALPLTLAGVLPAFALTRVFRTRPWAAAGTAAVAAAGIGAAVSGALWWPFEAIDAHWWGVAEVVALGSLAISLPLIGLGMLLGRAGLGVGAAVVVLLGSPLSGLAGAPELLPAGWGTLGQLLPPGATGRLLRSVAYFEGADVVDPLTVLLCWVVAGLLLVALAGLRATVAGRRVHAPVPVA